MTFTIGDVVDGYTIVEKLHPRRDVWKVQGVDVEEILKSPDGDYEFNCFQREGLALADLHDVCDVSILHEGTYGLRNFRVLSYVAGEDLKSRLLRNRLNYQLTQELGVTLCDKRERVHARRYVHLDLTPKNVIMGSDGQVTLIDHDLAQRLFDRRDMFGGTPGFASPEAIQCGDVDERSDVYGLGALLYCCVTGAIPFEGANAVEIFERQIECDVPDVRERCVMVPERLAETIKTATRRDKNLRFDSITAMKEELMSVVDKPRPMF